MKKITIIMFLVISFNAFSYDSSSSFDKLEDILPYRLYVKAQANGADDYIVEMSFIPNENKVDLIFYRNTGIKIKQMNFAIDKELLVYSSSKDMPAFVIRLDKKIAIISPASLSWNFSIVGIVLDDE